MIFCCQIAPNTASSFYFAITMGMLIENDRHITGLVDGQWFTKL